MKKYVVAIVFIASFVFIPYNFAMLAPRFPQPYSSKVATPQIEAKKKTDIPSVQVPSQVSIVAAKKTALRNKLGVDAILKESMSSDQAAFAVKDQESVVPQGGIIGAKVFGNVFKSIVPSRSSVTVEGETLGQVMNESESVGTHNQSLLNKPEPLKLILPVAHQNESVSTSPRGVADGFEQSENLVNSVVDTSSTGSLQQQKLASLKVALQQAGITSKGAIARNNQQYIKVRDEYFPGGLPDGIELDSLFVTTPIVDQDRLLHNIKSGSPLRPVKELTSSLKKIQGENQIDLSGGQSEGAFKAVQEEMNLASSSGGQAFYKEGNVLKGQDVRGNSPVKSYVFSNPIAQLKAQSEVQSQAELLKKLEIEKEVVAQFQKDLPALQQAYKMRFKDRQHLPNFNDKMDEAMKVKQQALLEQAYQNNSAVIMQVGKEAVADFQMKVASANPKQQQINNGIKSQDSQLSAIKNNAIRQKKAEVARVVQEQFEKMDKNAWLDEYEFENPAIFQKYKSTGAMPQEMKDALSRAMQLKIDTAYSENKSVIEQAGIDAINQYQIQNSKAVDTFLNSRQPSQLSKKLSLEDQIRARRID